MIEKKLISVDNITIDTLQSRRGVWEGDKKDQSLVDSVKGTGLIHDIIVRPTTTGKYGGTTEKPYALVAGSRRFHALIEAGVYEIPCVVMDVSDLEAIELSFSENLGRKDLTDFEKMITVTTWAALLEKEGMKKVQAVKYIAQKCFGGEQNTSRVYNMLSLSTLPKELQILIKEPKERTEEEKHIIEESNIKPDFKMDFSTIAPITAITTLLGDISDTEKASKVFSMIAALRLDEKRYDSRLEILTNIRDELKTGKSFDIVMKTVKEKETKKFKMLHEKPVQIKIPPNYEDWHKKAYERARTKPEKLILDVYLDWLTKEAKREGW